MEDSNPSLQEPLLNNQQSQPQKERTYLKTNFFDSYLLFWVDKLIKVSYTMSKSET